MSSNCEPIPDDSSDDIEMDSHFNYIAEYIIAKRVGATGKHEYLVKWNGWPTSAATWEPLSSFATPYVVNNFEKFLQEIGEKEPSSEVVLNNQMSGQSSNKPKANQKRKKVSEPMAVKFLTDLRKGSNKRKKGIIDLIPVPQILFDVEVSPEECSVRRRGPLLVGASKRKSKRVESTPVDVSLSVSVSYRSFRYNMRQNFESI